MKGPEEAEPVPQQRHLLELAAAVHTHVSTILQQHPDGITLPDMSDVVMLQMQMGPMSESIRSSVVAVVEGSLKALIAAGGCVQE